MSDGRSTKRIERQRRERADVAGAVAAVRAARRREHSGLSYQLRTMAEKRMSMSAMARELERQNFSAPRGGRFWSPTQVKRQLEFIIGGLHNDHIQGWGSAKANAIADHYALTLVLGDPEELLPRMKAHKRGHLGPTKVPRMRLFEGASPTGDSHLVLGDLAGERSRVGPAGQLLPKGGKRRFSRIKKRPAG